MYFNRNLNVILTLILTLFEHSYCYKPVVIMHGVLSGADSMMILQYEIEKNHPGTVVYNCDKYGGWFSLEGAWKQVKEIAEYLRKISNDHPEGVHLLGYSQGGLIARGVLQSFPEHNVKNFISLSSPQAGQYGTDFLHLIFPDLAAKTAFELFYSHVGQHTSVGNYWNDPHRQELFLKYSVFLPYINNQLKSSNSTSFKNALTKLNKMVLIGGPDDGVITPWQSSHFAYFNESQEVVPLHERDIYKNDDIGLKMLNDSGRLVIITKPNVFHLQWHMAPKIIKEVILPYLD